MRKSGSPDSIAADTAAAVAKANEHPGQIAALILPGDVSWGGAVYAVDRDHHGQFR